MYRCAGEQPVVLEPLLFTVVKITDEAYICGRLGYEGINMLWHLVAK